MNHSELNYECLLLVLVVYEKQLSDISLLKSLRNVKFNSEVFIYDNSLSPQQIPFLELNIKYVHDSSNPGVSTAYNKAFSYATQTNRSVVLILDQDTRFDPVNIPYYLAMYNKYGDSFIYAPIITDAFTSKVYSPSYMKSFVGKVSSVDDISYNETYSLYNKSVINSGLLVPLDVCKKVGGYNNNIKLDFSDIYFIEKYKEINDKVILLDCYIKHSLSGDEGLNITAEMKRFPYYCNGAIELTKSLKRSTVWTVLRRTISLVLKYRTITPILVFFRFYIMREKV
ncbi:glycosyltransferase [Shewanella sp.]|uniref:glycosyltransferase n=1 Tax=Shewanella sp. TaxID=50422 RepID=UPI004047DBD4